MSIQLREPGPGCRFRIENAQLAAPDTVKLVLAGIRPRRIGEAMRRGLRD